MNVLLIFVILDINRALFVNAISFCFISVLAMVLTFILPFTTIYATLWWHKFDLSVLNPIFGRRILTAL